MVSLLEAQCRMIRTPFQTDEVLMCFGGVEALRRGSAAVLSAVETDVPLSVCAARDKTPAATCAILRFASPRTDVEV